MEQSIRFTFLHDEITAADSVKVIKFQGEEGVSSLFNFTIELISDNADLDIDAILESPASLEISIANDTRKIQGIVSHFDAIKQINNQTLYSATLVPKLWELSLYHTNEIYLEKTVPEIIEIVLQEAGFTDVDYDLSGLQGTYKKWAFKCQYGETHLDFISRLMERDGIYYYFTEGESGEKVIFCDSMQAQEAIATPDVLYSPVTSLEIKAPENLVHSFVSLQKRLPYKVLVKDYNDDKPSVDIKGEAIIDDNANKNSEIYVWGQNIESPEEGEQLAKIRAEEIFSTKKTYHGESSIIRLATGFTINLEGHFRQACNQEYQVITITHEGNDPSLLNLPEEATDKTTVYNNQFSAIASDIQYRPAQLTAKPEIHGTLNAFVDAEGDGQYAELDDEGRYRITLPFDRIIREDGKSSHWLRMSQPFAGANQGMSFPLLKGSEVLLTFIGGDPDRPVIAGAIPNASQPSVTNSDNQTNNVIQTASGNKIEMEDKDGTNRIKLQTGDNKSYMHLGAPNHDGDGWVVMTSGLERKEITGGQHYTVITDLPEENEAEAVPGEFLDDIENSVYAFAPRLIDGSIGENLTPRNKEGLCVDTDVEADTQNINGVKTFTTEGELSGRFIFERTLGDKYVWEQGNEYRFNSPGDKRFQYGADKDVVYCQLDSVLDDTYIQFAHEEDDDGNEIHFQKNQRLNQQLDGSASLLMDLDNLRENFKGYQSYDDDQDSGYTDDTNSWEKTYFKADGRVLTQSEWDDLLDNKSQIRVAKHNTFNIQYGNIIDFGGYWSYSLGNGYTEDHGTQTDVEINCKKDKDLANVGGPQWTSIEGEKVTINNNGTQHVDKAFAENYSYTECAKTIEVSVVDTAESQTYGKTYNYQHGDTYEEIYGNSETHFGKPPSEEASLGAAIGAGVGSVGSAPGAALGAAAGAAIGAFAGAVGQSCTTEKYFGRKDEMMIGAASAMALATTSDMFLGAKSDMSLALANNVFIGASFDLTVGGKFTVDTAVELNASVVKAEAAAAAKISTALADLDTKVTDIKSSVSKVDNRVTNIGLAVFKLRSGALDMSS